MESESSSSRQSSQPPKSRTVGIQTECMSFSIQPCNQFAIYLLFKEFPASLLELFPYAVIGDKLSAIIEEVEQVGSYEMSITHSSITLYFFQPSHLGMSHRKRRYHTNYIR